MISLNTEEERRTSKEILHSGQIVEFQCISRSRDSMGPKNYLEYSIL